MDIEKKQSSTLFDRVWNRIKLDMQTKLVVIFLIVKIIPIVVMAIIAWFLIVSR